MQDIHAGRGLENPVNRLYTSNAAQPFHVDDADVVGELIYSCPSRVTRY